MCQTSEIPNGLCDQGVCLPPVCGDGYRSGDEECDAQDFGGRDCRDEGFYNAGPLACSEDCRVQTPACTGFCGDGQLESAHELCDGSPPALSCIDYGFGAGFLDCAMATCTADFADCKRFGWSRSTLPAYLVDVHGTADDNIFAVANNAPVIVHFDGQSWKSLDLTSCALASNTAFNAVWAIGPGDAVASSSSGYVVHVSAAGCSKLAPSGAAVTFADVWAADATHIFAVDDSKTSAAGIYEYEGSTWTHVNTTRVSKIWGSSINDIYAGTTWDSSYVNGGALVHYNGATWSAQSLQNVDSIMAIWGTGPSDVYLAGVNGITGIVQRYDGSGWTSLPATSFFWATTGTSAFGKQIVGGMDGAGRTALASEPSSWVSLGDVGYIELSGLWTSPSDTVYATSYASPYVYAFGGTTRSTSVLTEAGQQVEVLGTDQIFAVTSAGSCCGELRVWNGGSWADTNAGCLVRDVWIDATRTLRVVCADTTIRTRSADGGNFTAGSWSAIAGTPTGERIWGTGAGDFWVLAQNTSGPGGTLKHWNGSAVDITYSTGTIVVVDVYGLSGSAVYAVGTSGTILKFNGTSWATLSSPTTQTLLAVWGTGTDMYAVGAAGTVVHDDGSGWKAMVFPVAIDLYAVWGTGPSDVFVAGYAGALYHYDGIRWSPVDSGLRGLIPAIGGVGDMVFASDNFGNAVQIQRIRPW